MLKLLLQMRQDAFADHQHVRVDVSFPCHNDGFTSPVVTMTAFLTITLHHCCQEWKPCKAAQPGKALNLTTSACKGFQNVQNVVRANSRIQAVQYLHANRWGL